MGGGIIVSQNNQTGIIQVFLFGTERSLPVLTYTITDDLLLLTKCIQVFLCDRKAFAGACHTIILVY